jgi:hypothetical protein
MLLVLGWDGGEEDVRVCSTRVAPYSTPLQPAVPTPPPPAASRVKSELRLNKSSSIYPFSNQCVTYSTNTCHTT